ncbi:signal peptidase II [Rhizohabitans arisaemae]|uniref:signal peptidase II n=1 Tax=Rhizohabitans arisaemae TaxID=2720610 RepID=UPI0024B1799C|nr:signal peptidase II [Rhizohabitans arisaemae]
MSATEARAGTAVRRRVTLFGTAAVLAAVLMAAKFAADRFLADGRTVDLVLIQLRLTFNSGVSFSLGSDLPGWIVLAVPSLITIGISVYGWRQAPSIGGIHLGAVTAVLAGALANVLDRAGDGLVTDYLHTGWFPTFNLPDSLIVCGAIVLVLATWREDAAAQKTKRAAEPDSAS